MPSFVAQRDERSAPFFDAAERNILLLKRCPRCEKWFEPDWRTCDDGTETDWRESSGHGALVTWTVDHTTVLDPIFATTDGTRTLIGMVELDEGPWLQTAIIDTDPESLVAGADMYVRFVRPSGGEPIPVFSNRSILGTD